MSWRGLYQQFRDSQPATSSAAFLEEARRQALEAIKTARDADHARLARQTAEQAFHIARLSLTNEPNSPSNRTYDADEQVVDFVVRGTRRIKQVAVQVAQAISGTSPMPRTGRPSSHEPSQAQNRIDEDWHFIEDEESEEEWNLDGARDREASELDEVSASRDT